MSNLEHQEPSPLQEWRDGKETRAVVTPYAFSVEKSLLGQALAQPWRRGLAMLVDLLLVALLTHGSDLFIAVVAAIMVWQIARRHDQVIHAWARGLLRTLAALTVFLVALILVQPALEQLGLEDEQGQGEVVEKVGLSVLATRFGLCDDMTCVDEHRQRLTDMAAGAMADEPQKAHDMVRELIRNFGWLETEQLVVLEKELATELDQALAKAQAAKAQGAGGDQASEPAASTDQNPPKSQPRPAEEDQGRAEAKEAEEDKAAPSLIAWAQGLIADLGLGLSWGALYFTLFTTWLRGVTPGKWLLDIRVVHLDNSPITLWDAFGRYGGYGAGLATGLLGFLQIFWDANRQAIQDKVSATLVVQGRRPIRYTDATLAPTKQEERV